MPAIVLALGTNGGRSPYRPSVAVLNTLAVIVTVVWAVSFSVDIAVRDYDPPTNVHTAFLVLLGVVFGGQFLR
jgi:hypothetical protein